MVKFTGDMCNGWLVQLAWAPDVVLNPTGEIELIDFWNQRVIYIWVWFAICLAGLLLLIFQQCTQQIRDKKWKEAFGWILFNFINVNVWPLFNITQNDLYVTERARNNGDEIVQEERRHVILWWAVSQYHTISVLLAVWASVYVFKQMQLELVEHKQLQMDLQRTFRKENIVGFTWAFINLIFQAPLFGLIIQQTLKVQDPSPDFVLVPQVFSKTTAGLAVFVDILAAIFILVFLVLMIWQLSSLLQIISLTVTNSTGKFLLYACIPILVVLYINDVFKMMLWYWGFPAFTMTKGSLDSERLSPINENAHCSFSLAMDGNDSQLTHLGYFIRLIFVVSEVTPIVWATFFFVAFNCQQYARLSYDPLDYNHEKSVMMRQQQLDLINQSKKNTMERDTSNTWDSSRDYA